MINEINKGIGCIFFKCGGNFKRRSVGTHVIQNFAFTSPRFVCFACKTHRSPDVSRLNEWLNR